LAIKSGLTFIPAIKRERDKAHHDQDNQIGDADVFHFDRNWQELER
jgi:hypothetical protein